MCEGLKVGQTWLDRKHPGFFNLAWSQGARMSSGTCIGMWGMLACACSSIR